LVILQDSTDKFLSFTLKKTTANIGNFIFLLELVYAIKSKIISEIEFNFFLQS